MAAFVYDKKAIVNIQGMRWVRKSDKDFGTAKYIELEISYRGNIVVMRYDTEAERDRTFEAIAAALGKHANRVE
jgi:hypothetical protein